MIQNELPYNDYGRALRLKFGGRVQKISINTGAGCPNRDGFRGKGGCTYCNVQSFSPDYCKPLKTVSQQLQEGIDFFRQKYPGQKYLAYFQTYSNTYAELETLRLWYTQAAAHPDVVGIVIATRPDCLPDEVLQLLKDVSGQTVVSLELGVESTCDTTLQHVNRCHTWAETVNAIQRAAAVDIRPGAHLILGLPDEFPDMWHNHALQLNALPVSMVKIHHLQIIRHTQMAREYDEFPERFPLPGLEDYIFNVANFVRYLRPDITIARFSGQSPANLLIAPKWGGIRSDQIAQRIQNLMRKNNWKQGDLI